MELQAPPMAGSPAAQLRSVLVCRQDGLQWTSEQPESHSQVKKLGHYHWDQFAENAPSALTTLEIAARVEASPTECV